MFGVNISRRNLLQVSIGAAAGSASGWLSALAGENPAGRKRSCILLWMSGGPSQIDTFDPKPGHANGGSFKTIATKTSGLTLSECLPKLATQSEKLAVIRSMVTREGDHGRATYLLRTGNLPQPPIQYPTLGSLVAKELASDASDLPSFVSIAPYRLLSPEAYSAGYLGARYAPLIVGESSSYGGNSDGGPARADSLRVEDLAVAGNVSDKRLQRRLSMLNRMQNQFISDRASGPSQSHQVAYDRARRLMQSSAAKVFDIADEPEKLRDAYGRHPFGQGCLLARRLVERGVPFVEVSLNGVTDSPGIGWDTHTDNFEGVRGLCNILDPAWSTLLTDLSDRGLLKSTLVVWMGEFGRTPKINENSGRDHYAQAWSTVLAGGGIRGGLVVGKTSADGSTVEERPVSAPDLLATVMTAIGIDPANQNDSNVGRPIRVVDPKGKPIPEILT